MCSWFNVSWYQTTLIGHLTCHFFCSLCIIITWSMLVLLLVGRLFKSSWNCSFNNTSSAPPTHAKPLHPMYCLRGSSSKFQVFLFCTKGRWHGCFLSCGMSYQHIICKGANKDQSWWWKCICGLLGLVQVSTICAWYVLIILLTSYSLLLVGVIVYLLYMN